MRIAFYGGSLVPIHANSLDERPLGGTETALIQLAARLENLGNEVTVFTTHDSPPQSKPRYLPIAELEKFSEVDVFISVRDWIPCFYRIPSKKRFFWTGDSYDQFPNYGMGDRRVVDRIDAFLAVSQWQADEVCKRSGFPRDKSYVLRNGIDLKRFSEKVEKRKKRLIYSSTPHRGLEYVPAIYRYLKKLHPDIELKVFSSYRVYDQNIDFSDLQAELKSLPDAEIFESIPQSRLAKEFMEAGVLFYPCHFEETSCITAMEAMAAGCVVLSSDLGALLETVGNAGILTPGKPPDPAYISSFVKSADQVLKDSSLFDSLSKKAKERAQIYDWNKIAEEFQQFMRKTLNI